MRYLVRIAPDRLHYLGFSRGKHCLPDAPEADALFTAGRCIAARRVSAAHRRLTRKDNSPRGSTCQSPRHVASPHGPDASSGTFAPDSLSPT